MSCKLGAAVSPKDVIIANICGGTTGRYTRVRILYCTPRAPVTMITEITEVLRGIFLIGAGEVVEYQGQRYKVIQGHPSQSDWAPGVGTAALFQPLDPDEHHEPPQQSHESRHETFHGNSRDRFRSLVDSSDPVPVPAQDKTSPKPDSFEGRDGWFQDARHRTDELHRHGPRAPTTWVLVSGHKIPHDAIEAGREGDNALYVARAYVEDGLYVGKAGKHLRKGAEIGRQHQSHALHEYEVLIGDPRAIRWVETDGVPDPHKFGARHVDAGVDGYGYKIFITQVNHNGGIHPTRASGGASGAYLVYGGGELVFQKYRVLCYA